MWRTYLTRERALLLFLFFLGLLVYLVPFFLYGSHPLGYDTGFYRRYVLQPFESLPNAPVPGLGDDALFPRIILDLIRLTGAPPDFILYGSYILFSALIPLFLFLLLKSWVGTRGAAIAAALYIFSPIAYAGYWFFFFKNAVGLCFLLAAFFLIERRYFYPALLIDLLLALTHKTTALIYVMTLGIASIFVKDRRRELALHLFVTAVIVALVNYSSLYHAVRFAPVGIFLTWSEYIRLSLPLFLLILIHLRQLRKNPPPRLLLAFAGVACAFPILHLPFFERFFLFSNVALIALAAHSLTSRTSRTHSDRPLMKYGSMALICIVVGLQLGSFWFEVKALRPLVSEGDIAAIAETDSVVPPDATILTSTDEAPWYEGWTHAHIAAPGMLRDTHNFEEWEALWNSTSTADRITFLRDFDAPLYISTLDDIEHLIGTRPVCVKKISEFLYRFDCAQDTAR